MSGCLTLRCHCLVYLFFVIEIEINYEKCVFVNVCMASLLELNCDNKICSVSLSSIYLVHFSKQMSHMQ